MSGPARSLATIVARGTAFTCSRTGMRHHHPLGEAGTMATVTFCSGCGAALDLTDLADNRCPKCGQTAEFRPAESVEGVVQKLCCICGADVAGQPRMKDKTGAYFCIPCGQADTKKKHAVGTPCKDCGDKFP